LTRLAREKTTDELVQEAREFCAVAVLDGRGGLGPTAAAHMGVLMAAFDKRTVERDDAMWAKTTATMKLEAIGNAKAVVDSDLATARVQLAAQQTRIQELEQQSIDRMQEVRGLTEAMQALRGTAAFANSSELVNRMTRAEARVKELEGK
jgi:hypothetical protein